MLTMNNEEFLAAHDAYADALFRHCYFRVYNRELAKDLVQEAFCKTWSYIAKGQKIENIRAFLYRVANNLVIDEIRKRKPIASLDELVEKGFSPKDESPTEMDQRLTNREIAGLLESLDESYRKIIVMRFIDELSPKEIGQILNMSENVVSVRIYRGLKKLEQLVDKKEL